LNIITLATFIAIVNLEKIEKKGNGRRKETFSSYTQFTIVRMSLASKIELQKRV